MAGREPAWLTHMVDQRLAFYRESGAAQGAASMGAETIMAFLTDPEEDSEGATDRHQRTCDRCGVYVPSRLPFLVGMATRDLNSKQRIMFTFGVCERCGRVA